MPLNISDESKWEDAKNAFEKQYNHKPEQDWEWSYVNKIYQQMGGRFEKLTAHIIIGLAEQCKMKEIFTLSDIKVLVKKFIDNPIKSAIAAYLIYNILKSNTENYNEASFDAGMLMWYDTWSKPKYGKTSDEVKKLMINKYGQTATDAFYDELNKLHKEYFDLPGEWTQENTIKDQWLRFRNKFLLITCYKDNNNYSIFVNNKHTGYAKTYYHDNYNDFKNQLNHIINTYK